MINFLRQLETNHQITTSTDCDFKQEGTNSKKNGQTTKSKPFKQIKRNQMNNSFKNNHTANKKVTVVAGDSILKNIHRWGFPIQITMW